MMSEERNKIVSNTVKNYLNKYLHESPKTKIAQRYDETDEKFKVRLKEYYGINNNNHE